MWNDCRAVTIRSSLLLSLLLLPCAMGTGACRGGGYPIGAFYNNTTVPHEMDRALVTGHAQPGDKVGESCATGIAALVAWGDASVNAAKKVAGITEVHSVEFRPTVVFFGVYYQACTVVHGK